MKTPTMKVSKKKLKHIPALPPDSLVVALQKLDMSTLSERGRLRIAQMLKAAANPNAETPEAVMKAMPKERQKDMKATVKAMDNLTLGVAQRGRERLLAMDASEFEKLVSEANE